MRTLTPITLQEVSFAFAETPILCLLYTSDAADE